MATKIDRLFGLEWLKKRVDAAHKEAKVEAEEELARLNAKNGTMELVSTAFGADAGRYKYSKTRKKRVVEFHLADEADFSAWCHANMGAVIGFAKARAPEFGQEWLEATGELPDGVSRDEREEPPRVGPPKLYGFEPGVVEAALGGNLPASVNRLLLGEGEDAS